MDRHKTIAYWQPIDAHPVTMAKGEFTGSRVLLYSKQLGIVVGEVHMWADRCEPSAQVASFHGNAIEHWGVTHFAPLPEPPVQP